MDDCDGSGGMASTSEEDASEEDRDDMKSNCGRDGGTGSSGGFTRERRRCCSGDCGCK